MFQYIGGIYIPNDNPELGRESSVTLPLAGMGEKVVVKKKTKAIADGYYTVGTVHFKVKKGYPIPAKAEEVFYQDQPEEVTTASDVVGKRFAEPKDEVAADTEKPTGNLLSTASLPNEVAAEVVKPKGKTVK